MLAIVVVLISILAFLALVSAVLRRAGQDDFEGRRQTIEDVVKAELGADASVSPAWSTVVPFADGQKVEVMVSDRDLSPKLIGAAIAKKVRQERRRSIGEEDADEKTQVWPRSSGMLSPGQMPAEGA